MKSVLISTQPKWCELIASGKKKIEVRKNKPTVETPFKCYIYETQDKQYEKSRVVFSNGRGFAHATGKVIGEFVCDEIHEWKYECDGVDIDDETFIVPFTMLTREQLNEYAHGKMLYGWHISDLKIYDKPKDLSEFKKPLESVCCNYLKTKGCDRGCVGFGCTDYYCKDYWDCEKGITRPPQSWCYVEEI